MFIKIVFVAVLGLGASLTLASPLPEQEGLETFIAVVVAEAAAVQEPVLRANFKQIFNALLRNLEEAAQKLSGDAKEKVQQFKKVLVELEEESQKNLEQLREELQLRLSEAKKHSQEKFEEVKEHVKAAFEQKRRERHEKINDLQQEVSLFLGTVKHQ